MGSGAPRGGGAGLRASWCSSVPGPSCVCGGGCRKCNTPSSSHLNTKQSLPSASQPAPYHLQGCLPASHSHRPHTNPLFTHSPPEPSCNFLLFLNPTILCSYQGQQEIWVDHNKKTQVWGGPRWDKAENHYLRCRIIPYTVHHLSGAWSCLTLKGSRGSYLLFPNLWSHYEKVIPDIQ